MEGVTEKYTIRVTEKGLVIQVPSGETLDLTAVEALMLLDILRNEEETLTKIAEEASPLPFRMRLKPVE